MIPDVTHTAELIYSWPETYRATINGADNWQIDAADGSGKMAMLTLLSYNGATGENVYALRGFYDDGSTVQSGQITVSIGVSWTRTTWISSDTILLMGAQPSSALSEPKPNRADITTARLYRIDDTGTPVLTHTSPLLGGGYWVYSPHRAEIFSSSASSPSYGTAAVNTLETPGRLAVDPTTGFGPLQLLPQVTDLPWATEEYGSTAPLDATRYLYRSPDTTPEAWRDWVVNVDAGTAVQVTLDSITTENLSWGPGLYQHTDTPLRLHLFKSRGDAVGDHTTLYDPTLGTMAVESAWVFPFTPVAADGEYMAAEIPERRWFSGVQGAIANIETNALLYSHVMFQAEGGSLVVGSAPRERSNLLLGRKTAGDVWYTASADYAGGWINEIYRWAPIPAPIIIGDADGVRRRFY